MAFVNAISENREIVCPPNVRKIIAHEFLQNLEQIHVLEASLKLVLALQAESAGNSNSNSGSRIIPQPLNFAPNTFENLDKKGNKKDPDQKPPKSLREKKPKKSPARHETEKKGSQTVRTTKDEKNIHSKKNDDGKKSSVSTRQFISDEDREKIDTIGSLPSGRSVTAGRTAPREKRKTVALGTMAVQEETIEEGDVDKKRRISK